MTAFTPDRARFQQLWRERRAARPIALPPSALRRAGLRALRANATAVRGFNKSINQ